MPAGFAPGVDFALDDTEWWLSRLRAAGLAAAAGAAAPIVRAFYPHLADGHRAETARDSDAFTIWDGFVESGTPELDPRTSGQPQSASRMETLAQCPFRYFLKHVLRIEPPEEVERDTTRWLDPMKAGSLLHEVFRPSKRSPLPAKPDVVRHAGRIEELAETAIVTWRERSLRRAAGLRQRRQEVALQPRSFDSRTSTAGPWSRVAGGVRAAPCRSSSIASAEPVAIAVGSGASFLLRGSSTAWTAPGGTFRPGLQDRKCLPLQGRTRDPRRSPDSARAHAMALEQLLARAAPQAGPRPATIPGAQGRGPAPADLRRPAHPRGHRPTARPASRGRVSARVNKSCRF